jgi:transposase
MEAISLRKRRAVLADCDGGMGTLAVAIKNGVSPAWVRRLKQRRRETGEIKPRPPIKKTPPKWRTYAAQMEALLAEQPDITLREMREKLGVSFSLQTLSLAVRTLTYTFKKSPPGGGAGPPGCRGATRGVPCRAGRPGG